MLQNLVLSIDSVRSAEEPAAFRLNQLCDAFPLGLCIRTVERFHAP